jgi:hypothetical protein
VGAACLHQLACLSPVLTGVTLEEKVGARACARLADLRMLRPLDEVQVLLAAARKAGPAADRNVRQRVGR